MTRIKLSKSVECGDQLTAQDFHSKLNQFIEKNRPKDIHLSWNVDNFVPGFVEKMAVTTRHDGDVPKWMNTKWLCCLAVFGMGWPYRWYFKKHTGKTSYEVKKRIFVQNTVPPAIVADQPESSAKLWGGMSTFLTGDDSKQENTIQ